MNEQQFENNSMDIALIQRDVVEVQRNIATLQMQTSDIQKETLALAREALLIPQELVFIKTELSTIRQCLTDNYVTSEAFDPVRKIVYGLVGCVMLSFLGAGMALILKAV